MFSLTSAAGFAAENGQNHYPVGVSTIMNGALPGPGEATFYSYFQRYTSRRLNDRDGNAINAGFSADVAAWAPRAVYTWQEKLGPFFVASGLIVPLTRVELTAGGKRDVSTGMGDPVLGPINLYYINPSATFFAFGTVDIYVPIGRYDKNRLANNGLNYWAVAPSVSATWLPTPKFELSATLYVEFNRKNTATEYLSGNTVTTDFALGYRISDSHPNFKVSLQGFATKQFTDDKVGGKAVLGGNRGQAFGIGPQISYDLAKGKGGLVLKYQREFSVENRSQGKRLWFEFAVPI